jgi:hypothetical protein
MKLFMTGGQEKGYFLMQVTGGLTM